MPLSSASAFRSVTASAGRREVHRAFEWMHLHELQLRQWQQTMVQIPAPPFGEAARAEWFLERFRELGLEDVGLDAEGNALGVLPGRELSGPYLLVSAHLDTVFPASTPLAVVEDGGVMQCPGICDNSAGLTALLALIAALKASGTQPVGPVLFAANVGEEGEGDLRGMRHLLQRSKYRGRVGGCLVLEGSGTATTVTRALGSRRFRATVTGPGGHSWVDAGAPNPLVILGQAIAGLAALDLQQEPRTTIHVASLHGGDAINAIPREAVAQFDLRSIDADSLLHAEVRLHRAVEDAVIASNARRGRFAAARFTMEKLGDRPSAELPLDSRLWQSICAVDRHLGLRTEPRTGSTDANLPLAMGLPAVALGCGGTGGGVHTPAEWYDPAGRELALRRLLLVLLEMGQLVADGAVAEEVSAR